LRFALSYEPAESSKNDHSRLLADMDNARRTLSELWETNRYHYVPAGGGSSLT
jgi:hypothetical protein